MPENRAEYGEGECPGCGRPHTHWRKDAWGYAHKIAASPLGIGAMYEACLSLNKEPKDANR